MANLHSKLILRSKKSPFKGNFLDFTKSTELTHNELDNNFINLKKHLIYDGYTSGSTLFLEEIGGNEIPIDLNTVINSQDTFTTAATINDNYVVSFDTSDQLSAYTVDLSVLGPAGDDTEVQFNDNGKFGAVSSFTFDDNVVGLSGGNSITGDTFTAGKRTGTAGVASVVVNGAFSPEAAETRNEASGSYSFASGKGTIASGDYSHSEGYNTVANSRASHAEGTSTEARGRNSHSEGDATLAKEDGSHAEGQNTQALGKDSHSEGLSTIARGRASHVGGSGVLQGQSLEAIGYASFNHSMISTGYAANGAEGDQSAILGGIDHQINSNATNSAIIGGQEITATTSGTTYVPNLNINYSPSTNNNINEILVRDNNGDVLLRDADSITSIFTGNTSGDCIEDLYVSNIHGCSPITIHDEMQHSGSTATTRFNTAFGYKTLASGKHSHAEGRETEALGDFSHAEGQHSLASGLESHAEGGSTASWTQTHAEGNLTEASGYASHSEGGFTESKGTYSHAEGQSSTALGEDSHAEGNGTTASGRQSHAEGDGTTASGSFSHSENRATEASGDYSHAEGASTEASGNISHSEGDHTTASGAQSHAEGGYTTSSGDQSHAEGNLTNAIGNTSHAGGKGTFDNNLKALGNVSFNHSKVDGNYNGVGSDGTASAILGGLNHETLSDYSGIFAGSGNTVNTGSTASVILGGEGNITNSNFSSIENGLNETRGDYSHAEGYNTIAGLQQEEITETETISSGGTGSGFYDEGTFTITGNTNQEECDKWKNYAQNNPNAFDLVGDNCVINIEILDVTCEADSDIEIQFTSSDEGVSEECQDASVYHTITGTVTTVIQQAHDNTISHSEGEGSIATGQTSHAEGFGTLAEAAYSHSENYQTQATGTGSHAEGNNTTSSGNYSHSEGENSTASGVGSHAENGSNSASGVYSHAEGDGTIANSSYSHSEGLNTQISTNSNASHIEGELSEITGEASHGEGYRTIINAPNKGMHAEGYETFVITPPERNYNVGEGVSQTGAHAEGDGSHSFNNASHAEGKNTHAVGLASHSGGIGVNATEGPALVALGRAAFNHSEIGNDYGENGAEANRSAILGGLNQSIKPEAVNSGIIGGNSNIILQSTSNSAIIGGQNITADTAETAYVPNLNIDYEPSSGTTSATTVLARNDSTGDVEELTQKQITNSSKYAETIPNASATTYTINHNLEDTDIIVQLWDDDNNEVIGGNIENRQLNSVDVSFDTDPNVDVRVVVKS